MKLKYGMHHRTGVWETLLYGIQWVILIVPNNIFLPLVLAESLGFTAEMTAGFAQRTMIFLGLGTLIQLYLGHRVAVFEAVAAFWISIYMIIGFNGLALGQPLSDIIGRMHFLFILTGVFILVLTATGLAGKLSRLFTPLIMGVTLVLISIQVSGAMVAGMFASLSGDGADPGLVGFSLALFFGVLWLSFKGGRLRPLVGLIGLGGGWLTYSLLGLPTRPGVTLPLLVSPRPFALGMPVADWSLVPLAAFVVVIYLSNEIASINAGADVLEVRLDPHAIRRASYAGGVLHLLAAVMSSIALVPAALASGLISATGVGAKRTMAFGALLLVVLGMTGPVGSFLAAIPPAVSYSVSLSVFTRIMAMGLKNCTIAGVDERTLTITGVSVMLGAGIMFLPAGMFTRFGFLSAILGNGLFIGVLTAILLENLMFHKRGWD